MKKIKVVLAVAMVAVLGIALCACSCSASSSSSGSSSKAEKFDWYEAVVPEGFAPSSTNSVIGQEFVKKVDNTEYKIKVYDSTSGPASEYKAKKLAEGNDYTDNGQQKIGNYTWEFVGFTWNNNTPSVHAYADLDEKTMVDVTFFMFDQNNPDVKTFLENFKYLGQQESK